jgi:predicted Zn-dependent protease
MDAARAHFHALADALQELLEDGERYLASASGEDSDFVRLNHGRIRQAGHVANRAISVDLIAGDRHAAGGCTLSGDLTEDRAAVTTLVSELRAQRRLLAADPHLLYSEQPASSVREDADRLPASEEALAAVTDHAAGLDLVGIWASGGIHAGFASSFGQRSWHSVHTFNFDWSCHLRADRAVKCGYAGTDWDGAELVRRLDDARLQLDALGRAPAAIPPGRYRAYLAPAALEDLLGLLGWGGFSCKAERTRTTPLLRLATGEVAMAPTVTLVDDRAGGLTPGFTTEGFAKAPQVTLIAGGRLHDRLISPRSAREFGLTPNSGDEAPDSLAMAGGTLERAEILRQLGTGLFINNVWYCNYSDRSSCRITGMTRFACFWVEKGELVAPLPVMRFDDSIYHLLGDRLAGITRERDLLLSSSTYGGRSLGSTRVPGILVDGLTLTL